MWYLFFEIWLWLLLAFGLGWFMCWVLNFKNRGDKKGQSAVDDEQK